MVFAVSEHGFRKFGIDEPRSKTECVSYEDCGWFEKIKCIDDDHSTQNGLFIKDLELFMMVFERRLKAGKMPEFCFTEHLLRCYKNNANCPLKCYKEKFNFIDCIESQHLEKIRAAAELYYKNKGKKPKC
ncbi:hypothetical protein RN001_008780 [Aquatica leii]|uniref:Uncharacterized protein n=1 Tax=Aquatica leii TaxID=1421715 RepID=A0AAN7SHE4_9COLE|nr:hypothetical protein RN001_008780 [Aquatica leii]